MDLQEKCTIVNIFRYLPEVVNIGGLSGLYIVFDYIVVEAKKQQSCRMECAICAQAPRKYKCNKCMAPYCSVKCYKVHVDSMECTTAQQAASLKNEDSQNIVEEEPTLHAPFPSDDTVPPEKLQELNTCGPLRQLLNNPHLRGLLKQIDVAHNVHLAMTAAMHEPLFLEFADACMQVVEPMSLAERNEYELCS
ncbi:zinc finger HIT domain-containing protein 3 [Drosophila persimilis]|nr:zinc finger HIT domain-containing protein 3 [Drosophila persimilis]